MRIRGLEELKTVLTLHESIRRTLSQAIRTLKTRTKKFSDQKDAESKFRGQKRRNRERNTGEKQNTEKNVSGVRKQGDCFPCEAKVNCSKEESCSFRLDESQRGKGNIERETTRSPPTASKSPTRLGG